jgi:hypothetical protein
MNPTLPNIRESCRSHGLFPRKPARVLVACSGGADSVFLLHALWALRGEEKLLLRVVTFDHALRPDSAADAARLDALRAAFVAAGGAALPHAPFRVIQAFAMAGVLRPGTPGRRQQMPRTTRSTRTPAALAR